MLTILVKVVEPEAIRICNKRYESVLIKLLHICYIEKLFLVKIFPKFLFSHLSNAIVELGHGIILDSEEALSRSLLGDFVLKIPDSVAMSEFVVSCSTLW